MDNSARLAEARAAELDGLVASSARVGNRGHGIHAVSGAVGFAGGSAALAACGFDKAVDLTVSAFDVGL
jgi:hypothetical protein